MNLQSLQKREATGRRAYLPEVPTRLTHPLFLLFNASAGIRGNGQTFLRHSHLRCFCPRCQIFALCPLPFAPKIFLLFWGQKEERGSPSVVNKTIDAPSYTFFFCRWANACLCSSSQSHGTMREAEVKGGQTDLQSRRLRIFVLFPKGMLCPSSYEAEDKFCGQSLEQRGRKGREGGMGRTGSGQISSNCQRVG